MTLSSLKKFSDADIRWKILQICVLLVIATVFVYWKVGSCGFINFDDPMYVTHNQHVQKGLSIGNVEWAFGISKDKDRAYWHPLTWLSLMADSQFFGIDAGWYHLSSLLIHISSVLLLFSVLYLMTGAPWKSAFVSALFALHPLNVESVAWISERKNVLSTLFWLLTMLFYLYYAKSPSFKRYLIVTAAFTAGLLAKPMLVTLPFVLLLLDFWPLRRLRFEGYKIPEENHRLHLTEFPFARLLMEKIPLIVLSFFAIALSVITMQNNNQFGSLQSVPMGLRLENAIVSYVRYLVKIIWPHDLAVFYPFPYSIPIWEIIGSIIILAGLSFIFLASVKKAPYLLVGWLWFLGTLVPVVGIVQGGHWPAMADRWVYVPAIGIFIAFSWGIADLFDKYRHRHMMATGFALIIIVICILLSRKQVGYWKNSNALFRHTLENTSDNYVIQTDLGGALSKEGRINEAIAQYLAALKINSDYVDARYNLGNAYVKQGRTTEAIRQYRAVIKIKPDSEKAHNNLGNVLISQGRIDEAIYQYLQALKIKPDYIDARYNLGIALVDKGDMRGAVACFRQALKTDPSNDMIRKTLDKVLSMQRR